MVPACGVSSSHKNKSFSKTIFFSSDSNELCIRFQLLFKEKHAGNKSNFVYEETVAIVDNLLEYK